MTRRKLTTWIVAATLVGVAVVGIAVLRRNETAATQPPAASARGANNEQSADSTPAQIEQAPQRSPDVFMPPESNATGSSPPPPK